ncbi:histidine kinase [Streptomyces sp. WAC07149]|uniref:sensor histidine kinase n=1 Tax=Streptomyces sp. WAC07149 TaxID=2487425 RepID=UPI000F799C27|nr:sensor histidine kinase [Streptomyces sp. WAC07149]RST06172.1 histidine kinase [Streptomyces sp. WAC07149]
MFPERLEANALQALCRQVLAVRLVMIPLGAPLALGRTAPGAPTYLVAASVALTFLLSYALFRDWERLGPLLLRHRWLLAADMAMGALLLVTATPSSPLGLVALGTPLLSGLVYGWRGSAVFAAAQTVLVAALGGGLVLSFLCVLSGAAGSSVRDLLFRLSETRARLTAAEAVREERERLAREMHDSVSKTLHGLALAADALARTSDPAAVRAQAEQVALAARRAVGESRALLTDLRAEPVPLLPALHALDAQVRVTGAVPALPPSVARHVVAVAAEAVENVRRHAEASETLLTVSATGTHLTVSVEDDGHGLPAQLPSAGHYGVRGMRERAAAIGAALSLGPRPSGRPGTRVRLSLPLEGIR